MKTRPAPAGTSVADSVTRGETPDQQEMEARAELRRSLWAGGIILELLHDEDMRGIVRAHLATSGQSRTAVAREIGITKERLDQFLSGAAQAGRVLERLAAWTSGHPTPPTAPETVAVAVLTRWVPDDRVGTARAYLAKCTCEMLARLEVTVPAHVLDALHPRRGVDATR